MIATDFINRIEIQTAMGPPIVIDLASPRDASTQALLNLTKPIVIVSGPLGTFRITPDGASGQVSPQYQQIGATSVLGVLAGLAGVGLVLYAVYKTK